MFEPHPSGRWSSKQRWAAISLLLALTIATYSNSFSGVIEGDATALVSKNPGVHAATFQNLRLIGTQQYWSGIAPSAVFRPLVTLSWMINYVGFGNQERALGYHIFNLAFHLINVLLAWLVILRIWGDPLPAFFAAAIFALHPVNVEAVTNIAGRADLMAASGVLTGLLLHVCLPEWTGLTRRLRNAALAGLALASGFGLLSKENAIVLPAAMLAYDIVVRWRRADGRSLVRWPSYAAVLAPVVGILLWRHWVLRDPVDGIFVDNPLLGTSFWRARLTALEVLWRCLGLLAWPRQLSWDYSYHQIPLASTMGGLAALTSLLALLGFLGSLRRRAAPVCFFGMFFFLAIAPTSNLLLLIGSIMAERFLYLPSIGFAVCATAAVITMCRWLVPARSAWITAGAIAIALAALGARTWNRNVEWTDGIKLWENDVLVSPNSFKTHLARINAFYRRGMDSFYFDQSIEEARTAIAIVADLPPADSAVQPLQTLGSLYQLKGDTLTAQQGASASSLSASISGSTYDPPQQWYSKALEAFAQAVALDSLLVESERQRALLRGIPKERIRFGGSSYLYSHLGDTYRQLGRFPEALEAFKHLSAIAPTDAGVYEQIAQIQRAMGSEEDAIITVWKAQTLRPWELDEADLASAYGKFDKGGCAVSGGKPNQECPLVKTHLCRARREVADREAESGLPEESALLRKGSRALGCRE